MIDGTHGFYNLTCEICGESADEQFDDFNEAVECKKDKANGWKSQRTAENGWIDICPECQEKEV